VNCTPFCPLAPSVTEATKISLVFKTLMVVVIVVVPSLKDIQY